MNDRPQDIVRAQRMRLGYSDLEVAKRAGMTIDQYCELEDDRDDYYMVVPVGALVTLCDVLRLDIKQLFGLTGCPEGQGGPGLIYRRRKEKGISIAELSAYAGIAECAVERLERDLASISSWVMDAIAPLARKLDVPISCLLEPLIQR